jgi:DNA-binding NarL/FixJ family response regulator
MKLGRGYLTKQCAGENIVEAIQIVTNGEEFFVTVFERKYLILQLKI